MSETLRFELAPFGVRVVTCIAGGVKTRVWANFAEGDEGRAADLPPSSRYEAAAADIARLASGADGLPSSESPEVFAANLVNDVLAGATGKVYRGSEAGLTKWLLPIVPTWAMVSCPRPRTRIQQRSAVIW